MKSAAQIFDGTATVLDGVFQRLAAAVIHYLPHADARLVLLDEQQAVRRIVGISPISAAPEPEWTSWLLEDPDAEELRNSHANGSERSWIRAPLRVQGNLAGVVGFKAAPSSMYSQEDLRRSLWIADVIGALCGDDHLETSSWADGGAAGLEPAEQVLCAIAEVLDIRPLFPRISAIVSSVLPHDRLTMTFHGSDGIIDVEASSDGSGFAPTHVDPEILARPFVLFSDLSPEALADYEPPDAKATLLGSGFGSFLAVNVTARGQHLGVEFWSKKAHAFTLYDVPLARRIGTYIALAVAHQQLAESPRSSADVRRAAAADVDERVRTARARLASAQGRVEIAARSEAWNAVLRAAARVAQTDSTVLLTGESGTGKEVISRFIHAASKRSHGPFLAVNCAALPEQLLESELFGYERGAFTGATQSKPGQIELAEDGVLFLDEVSEMSSTAQAKFLRVLQEREFRRLGGTRLIRTNVRVIAATNTDLHYAIERGLFRRDLYYRLRVFDLSLPPLRARQDDILPLTESLLEEIRTRLGLDRTPVLTHRAHAALTAYSWPGNVRELRNVLERAAILSDGTTIDEHDLSFDDDAPALTSTTNLDTIERETIERVLRECRGNKSHAAKRLGLSRMQLYVRLRRYDITGDTLQ